MAQAAVTQLYHRKVVNIDLTEVTLRDWSIIYFDTKVYTRCEVSECGEKPQYIAGRMCKKSNRRYIPMCTKHYCDCGGCWCKQDHERDLSSLESRKNKEYVIQMTLSSSTMEIAETKPSSSGLPPPKVEIKSENKGQDRIKKILEQ